jgi:hypothetical protein
VTRVERHISKIMPCMHLPTETGTHGHPQPVHLHFGTPTLLYKYSTVHLQYGVANMQGLLVHNMRYLASVVSNCFTAFGELLALNKRFAELSGGVTRYPTITHSTHCIVCCHAKLACVRSICYVVQPSLTSGQGPSSDLLSAPLPCKSITWLSGLACTLATPPCKCR